ncbi:MAG: hypothetical protein KF858_02915 [Candidatus Sumerlaeia bacterium]|nr:hypothetical protein [Candidatus Sumerlaeia bacterium]
MVRSPMFVLAAALGLFAGSVVAQTLEWSATPTSLGPLLPAGIQMNGTATVEVAGERFVYIVGGNKSTAAGGDTTRIHYARIDGTTLGTWREATARLEGGGTTYHTRSTVGWRGRIFVVGGRFNEEGEYSTTYNGIRVFRPGAGGDIPADAIVHYSGETLSPSLDLLEMAAVMAESRQHPAEGVLYVLGGGSGSSKTAAVRSFRVEAETGRIVGADASGNLASAARLLSPLPAPVAFHQTVLHDGRLYVVGDSPASPTVTFATIMEDDSLSAWRTTAAPLREARLDAAAASFGGHLYVLGGTAGTNADTRTTVFRAEVGENGDIVAWHPDTPIPVMPGIRRIGATVTPDALLLIGGRLADDAFSPWVQLATVARPGL